MYTDPRAVDADYHFQGEFRGWQRERARGETHPAGLQIIALGRGQFGATNYPGGLPGDGWIGAERRLFTGQRLGDALTLTGGEGRLLVGAGFATLFDNSGSKLGEFHKVHRQSPTLGARPPHGALILFDQWGSTERFVDATLSPEGHLMAGTETVGTFVDFQLHAEFRIPYKPQARGQARGNSGFYLQSRYEVQVLDSFGLEGVENECGALYRTKRPDLNMCFPPLVWQTYDMDFTAPRFDADGNKTSNMRISIWHNGTPIHNDAEIATKTGAGQPEGPLPLPTKLQDHANPVVFRNIWIIDKSQRHEMAAVATVRARRLP